MIALALVVALGRATAGRQRCGAVRAAASAKSWAAALSRAIPQSSSSPSATPRSDRIRSIAPAGGSGSLKAIAGGDGFDLGGGYDAGGVGVAVGSEQLVGVPVSRSRVQLSDPG